MSSSAGKRRFALTDSQRRTPHVVGGLISGHTLKVARSSVRFTQEQFAELAQVDKTTVQGWESGRRPLTQVRASGLIRLRYLLSRLGVTPGIIRTLDTALSADLLLDALVKQDLGEVTETLSAKVMTRDEVDLLTWPLKNSAPQALVKGISAANRGRDLLGPRLGQEERQRLLDHLKEIVELASTDGAGILLRRQAYYLASFDASAETRAWLDTVERSTNWARFSSTWSPRWAEARSIATGISKSGDPLAAQTFVEAGRGDDAWETANLNYFAHWAGETRVAQSDDSFMAHSTELWRGTVLLAHLTERLDTSSPLLSLNAHTVWALMTSRKGLLDDDRALTNRLADQVTRVLDELPSTSGARRDLEAVRAGLTLAGVRI